MILEFADPSVLWAVMLLLPLAVILYLLEKLRLKRTRLVSNPNTKISLKFRHLALIPLLITLLLILALARPFSGSTTVELPGTSKDILVLLDISKSMLASDLKPTRLEFAKRKFLDIVKYSANKLHMSRIGIVLFSGESYLYCPLTEDYAVLEYFIKSISTDLITSQGTAIFDAVSTAVKSLEEVKAKDPSVILVSDGEDNQLETSAVIDLAKKADVKINVLATGTIEGSPISEPYGGFMKDRQGNIVISKLAEKDLREIAEKTGGVYQTASLTNSDILNLLPPDRSGGVENAGTKTFTIYNEKAHYLLAAVLLAVFIAIMAGKERLIFLFILAMPAGLKAESEDSLPTLNGAYHAYQHGDFTTAEKSFKYYQQKYPDDLKVLQSYASTLYKLGKFKEASALFDRLYSLTKEGKPKFEARYNSANSKFMLQDYKNAIKDYEEALRIKPADQSALYNLELAKKKLQEQMSKPSPTPPPTPTAEKQDEKKEENKEQKEKEEQEKENEKQEEKDGQDGKKDKQSENQDGKENNEKQEGQAEEKKEDKQNGKDSSDSEENRQDENAEGEVKEQTVEEMKESEAKAWLESLKDSPVLLRRKVSKSPNRSSQQW